MHDVDLSIRLKHGIHTIFLFVDPMQPFSALAQELLEILQERYPDGLTTSTAPRKVTELPRDPRQIEFGVPKLVTDPSQGWKRLRGGAEKPVDAGLKDGAMVAFAIRPGDKEEEVKQEEGDVAFEVEFPSYDDAHAEGDG